VQVARTESHLLEALDQRDDVVLSDVDVLDTFRQKLVLFKHRKFSCWEASLRQMRERVDRAISRTVQTEEMLEARPVQFKIPSPTRGKKFPHSGALHGLSRHRALIVDSDATLGDSSRASARRSMLSRRLPLSPWGGWMRVGALKSRRSPVISSPPNDGSDGEKFHVLDKKREKCREIRPFLRASRRLSSHVGFFWNV
jgi:hypothetical protein